MIAPRTTTIATLSSARSRPLSGAAGSVAVAGCDGMSKSVAKSGGASSTCLVRLAEVPTTSDTTRAERPLRRDAELNRQRILTAAADAFAEGGLGVTMDEIARRAGVGVGTVYRRFPDKELLVEAPFEQRIDEFVALAEAARDETDPFAGLVRFFETFLTVQAADRALKEVGVGTAPRARAGSPRGARPGARAAPPGRGTGSPRSSTSCSPARSRPARSGPMSPP